MSPDTLPILLWSLPLIGFLLGVALAFIGMRGRKIDDHPICRRCGYDLVGNPQAEVCPECGGDMKRPKAMKLGHRQRRRMPLTIGILLILPAIAVGAGASVVSLRGVDLQHRKPVWLLVSEADSEALKELTRRLGAGELTAAHVKRVNAHVLKLQANRARTWDPAWGDFIETARERAVTNDEQWSAYTSQALDFKLETLPRIRRGDRITLTISPAMDRVGSRFPFMVSWRLASVRLAHVPLTQLLPPGDAPLSDNVFDGQVVPRTYEFVPDPSITTLPSGAHPLHVDLKFLVRIGYAAEGSMIHPVSRQTSVTITPSGEPSDNTAEARP